MQQITFNGLTLFVANWSKMRGLAPNVIRYRMQAKWPVAQILGYEPRVIDRQWKSKIARRYEYGGENLTVAEWSKKSGIAASKIYERLKRGWTIAEAIEAEARKIVRIYKGRKSKRYDFNGEWLTVKQMAEIAQVNVKCVYNRLEKGLPIDLVMAPKHNKSLGPTLTSVETLRPVESMQIDKVLTGQLAKEIRRAAGITQQDMRQLMSMKAYDHYERGERPWTVELIEKFNRVIALTKQTTADKT